ncbi:MAG TPA: glycosyltransferase, partial [Gemmatimonadaceae bacterium]
NLRVMGVCPSSVLKVVSPHGTIRHDTGRSWAKQAWDATCGDRILRQADLMVALSEVEAREIRGLFDARNTVLRPDQVHVVPNGVDLSAFAVLPQRIDARRRFGLSDEGPVVLFFGRLTERKGIRLLIAAFDRAARNLPGAQLLVAGPDHGAHAAATALVSARGLDASVRFAGFLSGDDVLAAFAAADVFALPAIGEGIPLAALEALASGVPVLLSPDCNLQAAEDGGAVRIVPLDEKAWADALRELLVDPGTVASMRTAARGVAARFTWPSIAADMLHVYARARGAPRA